LSSDKFEEMNVKGEWLLEFLAPDLSFRHLWFWLTSVDSSQASRLKGKTGPGMIALAATGPFLASR